MCEVLADWAVEMSHIGYGQTRRQICEIVIKLIEKDHHPNPFKDNRQGKDWWYWFLIGSQLSNNVIIGIF